MKAAFNAALLAASLAGCAGGSPSPVDTRTPADRTLPPGEGAFGNAFTWEWRKQNAPAAPSSAPAATPPGDAKTERQQFEEWRAWQEWKRNQK